MNCKGLHCPGCGHGGGAAAALVVLAVIIAVVIRKPVEHAADDVLRVAIDALAIAAIAVASAAGLAAIAGVAYGARSLHRWHARNRQAIPRHAPIVLRASQRPSAPHEIGAPRPALYVVTSEHRIEEEK